MTIVYEIDNVSVDYELKRTTFRALHHISLAGTRGETLGIVGESGCGKSTLAKALLGLKRPSEGSVLVNGQSFHALSGAERRALRRRIQMVFQDPDGSLNPKRTIRAHLEEANPEAAVEALLQRVQLSADLASRYPHELSGGQKQRVSIARAISVRPDLIVLDEPLSSLDMSIRVQVLQLLKELQERDEMAYLFITHDLATLRSIAHRVGVMYLGYLVELCASEELFREPLHPYTKALLSAIPIPDPRRERARSRIILKGDIPSAMAPPPGCPFHTRCPMAKAVCSRVTPELQEWKPGHWAACHFAGEAPL